MLLMIWEKCRCNARVSNWINNLHDMNDIVEGWEGIKRLALRKGWVGSFGVPAAAGGGGAAAAGGGAGGDCGESPFDPLDSVKLPLKPPRSVTTGLTDNNQIKELSDMDDSVATVVCEKWHDWEELDHPTYAPVVGTSCFKCGIGFSTDGYRVRRSTPAHHCKRQACGITVCHDCRKIIDLLTSPPRCPRRNAC